MLTIAIPTMRRWDFLKDTLPIYLARPEVLEVILCDETGEDCSAAEASGLAADPKLRLYRNEKRLGIYENKRKALSLARGSWVGVFDSDNIFTDESFEVLSTVDWSKRDRIYGSADFKTINLETLQVNQPCTKFSGHVLNSSNWNSMLTAQWGNFLLNDGNWIVPAEACVYLPKETKSSDLLAADAIYMLRCFIKGGYSAYYVPGLEYIHTVHPGSTWIQTAAESTRIYNETDWRI